MPSREVRSPLHPMSQTHHSFSKQPSTKRQHQSPCSYKGKDLNGTLITSTVLNGSISSSVPNSLQTHQSFSDAFTSQQVLHA